MGRGPAPCTLKTEQAERQIDRKEADPVTGQARIETARIPQHTKLQIGAIFYRAFMRDYETPEFQEFFRRWQQEKAAQAAGGKGDG